MLVADTPEKLKLRSWLNKNLRIEMSDGRILVGAFLCTDRDSNIILSSCAEFLNCTCKYDCRFLIIESSSIGVSNLSFGSEC